MYSFYQISWFFLIYSLLGWIVEVSFVALTRRKLVNRGFLNGPVCPIYGFGMISVLLVLEPFSDSLPLLFVGGMLLCTAVEFFGGWVLDKIFHMRWWDYSDQPLNFCGYICLGCSLLWGLGVVLIVRVVHPLIFKLVTMVPFKIGIVPLVLFYIVYAIDLVVTLKTIIGISKSLGEMEKIAASLHQLGDEMSQLVGGGVMDVSEKLGEKQEEFEERIENSKERISKSITEFNERRAEASEKNIAESNERKAELQSRIDEMQQRSRALQNRIGNSRILRAFPSLKRDKSSVKLSEELKKLGESWKKQEDRPEE